VGILAQGPAALRILQLQEQSVPTEHFDSYQGLDLSTTDQHYKPGCHTQMKQLSAWKPYCV